MYDSLSFGLVAGILIYDNLFLHSGVWCQKLLVTLARLKGREQDDVLDF